MHQLQSGCLTWRCGSGGSCDREMFDQVLYDSSSWSDIGVDTLGVGWGGVRGGWDGRDGLLGTMRRKAFNKIDLERDKEQSSSGYSSFCMKICCYVSALHLYLSWVLLLWQKLLRYLRICHFFCYSTIILWSMSSSTIDNNKKKQQQPQPQPQQQQH